MVLPIKAKVNMSAELHSLAFVVRASLFCSFMKKKMFSKDFICSIIFYGCTLKDYDTASAQNGISQCLKLHCSSLEKDLHGVSAI